MSGAAPKVDMVALHSDLLACVAVHPDLDHAAKERLTADVGRLIAVVRTRLGLEAAVQEHAGKPLGDRLIEGPKTAYDAALEPFRPARERAS